MQLFKFVLYGVEDVLVVLIHIKAGEGWVGRIGRLSTQVGIVPTDHMSTVCTSM